MNSVQQLRHVFRKQLFLRGILSAIATLLLIAILALLTFDLQVWWFHALPWLNSPATWFRTQDPWNFFFIVFIFVNVIGYSRQVQGVFFDRHNAHVLVKLSAHELASSESPAAEVGKRRAALNGRRRLLESVLSLDPLFWAMGSLVLAFVLLGHYWAAASIILEAVAIVILIPFMMKKFTELRSNIGEDEEDEAPGSASVPVNLELSPQELKARRQALRDPDVRAHHERNRAEQSLADAAERMMALINRPLVRLRIGWPVIAIAATAVGVISVSLITEMSIGGDLPARATLLILLLVLASSTSLRVAQNSEDLAFFASALEQIMTSPDGSETL